MILIDAIQKVVDLMKSHYTVTGYLLANNVFTVTYSAKRNFFQDGMYVEFDGYIGRRYKIFNFTDNGNGSYTYSVNVASNFTWGAQTYFNLFLEFYYGHAKEIQMDINDLMYKKRHRFPFLAMFLNITEDRDDLPGIELTADVNFVIIIDAQSKWRAAERTETSFKQVLHPVYKLFINTLKSSGYFATDENDLIKHGKVDNYHYSADEAKKQNTLAVIADAVEINNIELNLFKNNCYE